MSFSSIKDLVLSCCSSNSNVDHPKENSIKKILEHKDNVSMNSVFVRDNNVLEMAQSSLKRVEGNIRPEDIKVHDISSSFLGLTGVRQRNDSDASSYSGLVIEIQNK